ncbi:MAG: hypothetical protein CMD13_03965 [Flavobacteriales bacterium]|nr:hypothetical protein [Flavobacteriales bacterium]
MKNYNEKLLIVIPFYNESGRGSKFCEELFREFGNYFSNFKFFLIDDCSSDDTYIELFSFSEKHQNETILVKNNVNLGHGPSIVSGYQYGHNNSYDYVVQIDGDNAAEPGSIASMVKFAIAGNYNLTLGKRVNRPDATIRKIITLILYINLYIRFGVVARDSNVGIRVLSKQYLNLLQFEKIKELKIPNAFITAHSFYFDKSKTAITPVIMRMNIETGREGEQWGNGSDIKSILKLLKGAYYCFLEVNSQFKRIIKN